MVSLRIIYEKLLYSFGPQNWWPSDTDFEMMVGAILTQNVNWNNVETAIDNLKDEGLLTPKSITEIDMKKLEMAVKPSGFYRQKSKRLKRLSEEILNRGGVEPFLAENNLRENLLTIKGIGPETADSMVLYAAGKPTFVIDAYTKRIMKRVEGVTGSYRELKTYFENELPKDVDLYKEFHALLVELGKKHCKKGPDCEGCPLASRCRYMSSISKDQDAFTK